MPKIQSDVVPRRSIGVVIVAVVAAMGLALFLRTKAQKIAPFTSDGPATVAPRIGNVTAELQSTAQRTTQEFLEAARRQDYVTALKTMADGFPPQHSVPALKALVHSKTFPIIFAGPLLFEPAHIGSRGRKMYVRASLVAEGKPYRTVISFQKQHEAWLISDIVPPVAPSKPATAEASGGAKSQR